MNEDPFAKEFPSKIIPAHRTDDIKLIFECLGQPTTINLLFRASEHEFLAEKFHQLCDGKANTFTLIKTKFGKTIAGFTPLKWESHKMGTMKADP